MQSHLEWNGLAGLRLFAARDPKKIGRDQLQTLCARLLAKILNSGKKSYQRHASLRA